MTIFYSICEVLEEIKCDSTCQDQRAEASRLLNSLEAFDFVFCLHLMVAILGITNELNTTLQKKDQDIVNAMHLVKTSKHRLQEMRDGGWESLLENVNSFCIKYEVELLNMEESYFPGKSRRKSSGVSNLHHYQVDIFYSVIDMQLQELNNRFNEVNTTLLISMASLSPGNSFQQFDETRSIQMAEYYPSEFSKVELVALREQLRNYIADVRGDTRFDHLKGIADLAKKMVETSKCRIYPMVYLLLKLALILPVATSTVERAFSAMKLIKSDLRNKMGDQYMNDCLVAYIEKDALDGVSNEKIIDYFQSMKTRRNQL